MRKILIFAIIFFFWAISTSNAEKCAVTRILDGDTFHCKPSSDIYNARIHKDGTITVRMRGIDAPEKRQPSGMDAQESLRELIGRKTVNLEVKDIDKYGRVVAYVFSNGININLEQVRRGYAWAYTEYLDRPYASEFYEAEKIARSKRLGLWAEANPIPPWEWRRLRKRK